MNQNFSITIIICITDLTLLTGYEKIVHPYEMDFREYDLFVIKLIISLTKIR